MKQVPAVSSGWIPTRVLSPPSAHGTRETRASMFRRSAPLRSNSRKGGWVSSAPWLEASRKIGHGGKEQIKCTWGLP